ncbi:MAG: hypothetical protein HKP54_02635 [Boseongicola sp.]|nr:hypothetical protein [Boseongicola sp.]
MLDMQNDLQNELFDKINHGPLDPSKLINALKSMSAEELSKLEDDLDFAVFTGIQSSDIKTLVMRLESAALERVA